MNGSTDETCGALTRVRYFAGQVLTSEDLEAEQAYLRAKHRRHNLALHGVGIVTGLEVTVESLGPKARPFVKVSKGVAIGPDGEELHVCEPITVALPRRSSPLHVNLGLIDREVGIDVNGQAHRVEEAAEVTLLADVPAGRLAIARVEHVDGAWRHDPGFRPLRLTPA